jgi:phosphinothricin acetyltransferase
MLNIRLATTTDLPAITDIYNEAIRNTTATFDTEEKTVADRLAWFTAHDNQHPVTVAEQNGVIVGWASLSQWSDRCAYDGTAEASLYVHHNHRSQGIGKALFGDIIKRGEQCGLHTVVSRIAAENGVSVHLHEEVGFFHIGVMREVGRKFGRLLDVVMMQLIYPGQPQSCDAATTTK